MPATTRFSLDGGYVPLSQPIGGFIAGNRSEAEILITGFNPATDVVDQVIFTAKINPLDADNAPTTVQKVLIPGNPANGTITAYDSGATILCQFDLLPADTVVLLAQHVYDVTVWVTRSASTYNRTVQTGTVVALQGVTSTTQFTYPTVEWASIQHTPTTIAGYGITDAYTKTESDARYLQPTGNGSGLTNLSATALATGIVPAARMVGAYGSITGVGTLTSLAVTGAITAGSVVGPLTGNVTGNLTGNVTGNVAGNASTATQLLNPRTINGVAFDGTANITITSTLTNALTIGSYLTGGSFNGSAPITIAVNASTAAVASTIVARDASANITANLMTATMFYGPITGAVTGNVTGNADTATKLSSSRTFAATGDAVGSSSADLGSGVSIALTLAAGVVSNANINAGAAIADSKLATIATALKVSNSATTATAANTASAIVARDGSGNFAAGTITATFVGAITGNADTATKLSSARTFALTGDVTGSVSSDLTAGASIATTLGTVPTTKGGTGLTSYTAGDLAYYAAGTAFSKLAIGAANAVLTSSGSAPQWSTALSGLTSVTSTAFVGTLSTAAQPNVTSLGTLTALTISGALSAGATTLTSTLAVAGTSSFGNTLTVTLGGLTVSAGTTAVQALTATTGVFSSTLASGSQTVTGTMTSSGALTVSSGGASITGAVTLSSTLGVTGVATLTAGTAATLTFGTHLTGTSYNSSANVTLATDAVSTNTVSTIVARDASGNFSAGAISATSITLSSGTAVILSAANAAITFGGVAEQIYRNGSTLVFRAASADAITIAASGATTIAGALTVNSTASFTSGTDADSTITIGSGGSGPTALRTVLASLNTPDSVSNHGEARVHFSRAGTLIYGVGLMAATSGPMDSISNLAFRATGTVVASLTQAGQMRTANGFYSNANGGGIYQFGSTAQANAGIMASVAVTAASGAAFGTYHYHTLTAAANGDSLTAVRIDPLFTPGALTGVLAVGQTISGFSTAAFTSPADPISLNLGAVTGTGATNAFGLYIANVSGATTNFSIYTNAGTARFGGSVLWLDTTAGGINSEMFLLVAGTKQYRIGLTGAANNLRIRDEVAGADRITIATTGAVTIGGATTFSGGVLTNTISQVSGDLTINAAGANNLLLQTGTSTRVTIAAATGIVTIANGLVASGTITASGAVTLSSTATGSLVTGGVTNDYGATYAVGLANANGILFSKQSAANSANRVFSIIRADASGGVLTNYGSDFATPAWTLTGGASVQTGAATFGGALTVNATGSVFSAGTDASSQVAIGSNGGSPTAQRVITLSLDGPSSGSFKGTQQILFRQNAVTGAGIFQGYSTTGVMGSISDLAFNFVGGAAVMALSTSGALTLAAGITSTTAVHSANAAIGGALQAGSGLYVANAALTGTTQVGVDAEPTFNSASTTGGYAGYFRVGTAAAAFTMTTGTTVFAQSPSLGAGSAITTMNGVFVANQGLAGSTNAYGVFISPQSGATTNIGLYNGGTSALIGNVNIGFSAANTNAALDIESNANLLTTAQYGIYQGVTFASSATSTAFGIASFVKTAAAAFTVGNAAAFYANTPTLGAASAVTNQYGAWIRNQGATGVTNAYGLYLEATSGAATTNISLYNAGTSTFAGTITVTAALLKFAAGTTATIGTFDNFNVIVMAGNTTAITVVQATLATNFAGNIGVGGQAASASTAICHPAGTTAISSLRIPHGVAPTSPVDGDMWTTTGGAFIRINGVTKTFTLT